MIPGYEQLQRDPQPVLPPLLVDHAEALTALRESLRGVARLAVDTESNSLYAYRERVCLIQISTDQADFLLDPLAFPDEQALGFLGETVADPAIEKVFHAAEYDVMVLRRDFGFTFAGLFDTSIAARILGWHDIGLGAILESHFGVHINKRHQRANWGLRPLSADMMAYAQLDIHYLLRLRDLLHPQLEAAGYLEENLELSQEVADAVWSGGQFDPEGFWRINGVRTLSPKGAAVMRELYHYREEQARHLNLPVFKVIPDSVLVEIASRRPRSEIALRAVRGMSAGLTRRYAHGVLGCVERGLVGAPVKPPARRGGPDDLVLRRFDALHLWRKERAMRRGVLSDIIMSKDALWELAQIAPRSPDQLANLQHLGPWRTRMYGEEVLRVLAQTDHTYKPDR
jgi:ribonuclease D